MALQPIPTGPLRSGYTTGANATACAKAALLSLLLQQEIKTVNIILPQGEKVLFNLESCTFTPLQATCTIIKDAGDDPDVTHQATIGCTVALNTLGSICFLQGEGVGVVTLPGLSIPVGEPAINPVPRKMITDSLSDILQQHNCKKGVNVTIFVKNGAQIAQKTLNSRIGIINGISILGTTGIVKPFSASAYIASITQGIDVAFANGCTEIVINSGGRSEKTLKNRFSYLPDFAFIQYGNWIGETFAKIQTIPITKVTLGIMLGKAAKLAQGELDTHSGKSSWDKNFIYQLAINCGYSSNQCSPILELNMARRLTEIFPFSAKEPFYQSLLQHCYSACKPLVPKVSLQILLIDNDMNIVSKL